MLTSTPKPPASIAHVPGSEMAVILFTAAELTFSDAVRVPIPFPVPVLTWITISFPPRLGCWVPRGQPTA